MSRRYMLKPAHLQLIHEIASHRQLQVAAEALAMTQPAASRMLAEAERQVGAALFIRQPKGMEPTEIGRAVLRRGRAILREMASIATDVRSFSEGRAGSVRVGAVTGPAVSCLVEAIRAVKEDTPGADITVDVMPSRELLSHLEAGEMDLVLARILPEFDSHNFNILPMRDEGVAFICRQAHPLARAPSVTLTELADSEWIMQQRGAPIREATLAAFADVGLPEPGNIVNSPSLLLTMAYLAQSDAIAPVSDEVADLLINPPVAAGFGRLRINRQLRVSPYYLLDLRRRPLTPLATRLRDRLAQGSVSALRHLDAAGHGL